MELNLSEDEIEEIITALRWIVGTSNGRYLPYGTGDVGDKSDINKLNKIIEKLRNKK